MLMKKLSLIALLMLLLTPVLLLAQSAFDGTWKVDMNKVDFPKKPDVYLLQNGMYECKTCAPPVKIKADGQDQTVAGHPYYDTAAIKVISDHEIEETDKKNGKTVATSKTTVSPDGNTLMFEFSDSSNTNAAPVTGKGIARYFRFLANFEIRDHFRQRDYLDVQGQRRRVDHDQSDGPILHRETGRHGSTVQG
jgi:hypothetical protein